MNDDERRDADALRDLLAGDGDAPTGQPDLEVVGLFNQASGSPAIALDESDRVWERIRTVEPSRPPKRRAQWAWLGYAVAASVVLLLLLRPAAPGPLPPGPSESQRRAALSALDPTSGPPMARLGALHAVATAERERLVAELGRD